MVLSISLHAFSAVVALEIFPDKKRLAVSPIPSMQNILTANLKPEVEYSCQLDLSTQNESVFIGLQLYKGNKS